VNDGPDAPQGGSGEDFEVPPDFDHWLDMDLWQPLEAVALLRGVSPYGYPGAVSVKTRCRVQPLGDALQRAVLAGRFNTVPYPDPTGRLGPTIGLRPREVLEWASAKRRPLPPELQDWLARNPPLDSDGLSAADREILARAQAAYDAEASSAAATTGRTNN
jgi:hypothetical protein